MRRFFLLPVVPVLAAPLNGRRSYRKISPGPVQDCV
jgi:hypothetical protein